MDKNRIEGRQGAPRWHNTPKAAGMPLEVNAAAVRWNNVLLPGEWERSGHSQPAGLPGGRVQRGKSRRPRPKPEDCLRFAPATRFRFAGFRALARRGVHPMKGRTNEEGIDPAGDESVDDAGWRDGLEGSGGGNGSASGHSLPAGQPGGRAQPGNHGAPQVRNMIEEILDPGNLARAWTATARQRTEMAKPSRRAGPQGRINACERTKALRESTG